MWKTRLLTDKWCIYIFYKLFSFPHVPIRCKAKCSCWSRDKESIDHWVQNLLCITLNYSGMLPSDWWYSQAIYPWKAITMPVWKQHLVISCGGRQATSFCVCVCATRCCANHEIRVLVLIAFVSKMLLLQFRSQFGVICFPQVQNTCFIILLSSNPDSPLDRWWHLNTKALKKIWSDACTRTEGMKFAAGSCIFMYIILYIYICILHST